MPPAEPLQARSTHASALPARPPPRRTTAPIDYPESDGKPMAESTIHWEATVDGAQPLKIRYGDRPDAFVGSDLLMYYEEGKPKKSVAPDVFVTFGVPRDPPRPKWLVWEEGAAADFVLEITSKSTRNKDEGPKKRLYATLGVREYWQYDPTGDYLVPVLKGHRLGRDGRYQPLDLAARGSLLCGSSEVLGLELHLDGKRLRYFDPEPGAYLTTNREKEEVIQAQREALQRKDQALLEKDDIITRLQRRLRQDG